jgi:hypothetical protein
MRRRSWIRRPVLSVPRTPPSFRRGDPGDRPNLVDDNHQGEHEVRPYNGSRRFHGCDSALRSPHPRPRGGNGAGWPASKRWPFSPKGSTAFRRSPSVRTGTPAPACISSRNTRQAGNGWGTARRARTREADGAPMVFVSQPSFNPLDPPVLGEEHKSWGHPRPRQEESCTAFETSSGIAPYFSSRMVVLVGGWVKRRLGRRGLALHTVSEQSMMACL